MNLGSQGTDHLSLDILEEEKSSDTTAIQPMSPIKSSSKNKTPESSKTQS